MEVVPCTTCSFCDFMTYSTEYFESHMKAQHPGTRVLPKPNSKIISKSISAKVRQADELFHSQLTNKKLLVSNSDKEQCASFDNESPLNLRISGTEEIENRNDTKSNITMSSNEENNQPELPNCVNVKVEPMEVESKENTSSDVDQALSNQTNSFLMPSSSKSEKQHKPLSIISPITTSERETILVKENVDHLVPENKDLKVEDAHQPVHDNMSSFDESKLGVNLISKTKSLSTAADESERPRLNNTPELSVGQIDAQCSSKMNSVGENAEGLEAPSQESERQAGDGAEIENNVFDADSMDLDGSGICLCHVCNMAFSSNLVLEIHEKRWHNESSQKTTAKSRLLNFNQPKNLSDEDSMAIDGNHSVPEDSSDDSTQDSCSRTDLVKKETGENPFPCLKSSDGSGLTAKADLSSNVMITQSEGKDIQRSKLSKRSYNKRNPNKKPSTTAKPFKCHVCEKHFRDGSYLEVHLRTHTGEKPYKCGECLKDFSRGGHLMVHMRTHTGEKPFSCGECGKSFIRNDLLHAHMRIHTEENPYRCHECGKTFSDSNSVKRHLKTHSGEKPYICKECGNCFARNELLMVHMRTHTGEKPFRCDVCDKRFGNNSNLQIHLRTHTGEKPFKCKVCGKHFRRSGQVNIHMRVHTGEKPFQCNECGKHISSKDQLLIHIRTHTGEKPYSCNECGKSFCRNGQLQIHLRSHTGERPFVCIICTKGFSNKSSLTRHMKLHPGEEEK